MGRWIRITELVKDYAYSVWVIEGSKIVEDYLWHGKRDEVKKKVEEKFNVKCQEWRGLDMEREKTKICKDC